MKNRTSGISRSISTILFFAIVLSLFSSAAFAITEVEIASDKMMISPYPGSQAVWGQNQFYSVVFDGEGDAIVAAKIKLQNTGKENLTKLTIEVPGESIRMINIMQEVQKTQKQCGNWNDVCVDYDKDEGCLKYERDCMNWYEQPSWPPYYYTVDRTEQKLSKSSAFELELPVALESQQTGTLIFYYKVQGYASKSFGVYDFDFETMKMDQDVNQIRVSINVLDGLYLNGGQANIDYRSDIGFAAVEKASAASEGMQSNEISDLSNRIEYQQGYTKSAQGIDPLESFHVKGEYATSWFMLHKIGMLIGIIIIISVFALIFWGVKKMIESNESIFSMFGLGTGSAVLIIGSWVVFGFVIKNINNWIGWQYGGLVSLLLILLAAIIDLALLLGPSIYVGIQRGVKYGFMVFGITIVSLVVLSIVFIIMLALFQQSVASYPPYRMLAEAVST